MNDKIKKLAAFVAVAREILEKKAAAANENEAHDATVEDGRVAA